MSIPLPPNEPERLQALQAYGLMDTPPEPVFDEVAALASYVFATPIALIGLIGEHRQWFKSRIGLDLAETHREHALCAHTILRPEGMVVPDALADPRFATNPMVLNPPRIRFYAGVPLTTREGHALGTLCVIDTQPRRRFDPEQEQALRTLGRHLMAQIEIRYSSAFLAKALTERRQAELDEQKRILEHGRELSRLNEMKDRFMTMLAHELRSPIAAILNGVELLRLPDPDDALEVIENQARNLSRLVEDLLDLSRMGRGTITLKPVPLDMGQTVHAAARAVRGALASGGQRFSLELPPEPLWMMADPVRLEQIVTNLLINAIKFTEPGREIALSLRREEGQAVLCVRDEGIGIPPEMQEHIFEPFVQVNPGGGQDGHSGVGIGLALVRQLVQLHHGSIAVRSEGAGRGSEFTVRLPLSEEMPPAESAPMPEAAAETGAKRVLVVEDNPGLGATLARLISRWGHEARLVPSGAAALEHARAFRPQLAIIDIGLPQMDGFSVAECLSADPKCAGMKLIAMSGYGEESERNRARQSGFHEFLLKPVDASLLRKLLSA